MKQPTIALWRLTFVLHLHFKVVKIAKLFLKDCPNC